MTRGEEALAPAAYSQTGDYSSMELTGYSLTRNSKVISPRATSFKRNKGFAHYSNEDRPCG